jgi:hypothetical protein
MGDTGFLILAGIAVVIWLFLRLSALEQQLRERDSKIKNSAAKWSGGPATNLTLGATGNTTTCVSRTEAVGAQLRPSIITNFLDLVFWDLRDKAPIEAAAVTE